MLKRAYLYQKKIAYNDDEIKNEERKFLDGAIPFRYLTLKHAQVKDGKIAFEKNTFVMKTQAEIDFKSGDAIKIGSDLYSIIDIIFTIDEKHEQFIEQNPNAKSRFEVKELTLRR